MGSEKKKQGIVLFGAGGFAIELLAWLEDIRRPQEISPWYLRAIAAFVDTADMAKEARAKLPVIHDLAPHRDDGYLLATGSPPLRARHSFLADAAGLHAVGPMVHPRAMAAPGAIVGVGSVLCPGVFLCPTAEIGNHVLLNIGAVIGHESKVGDFSVISPLAVIGGRSVLGKRVFVGANASVREPVRIADDVTIGMGAVVLHDITEPGTTWVGNPARKIETSP